MPAESLVIKLVSGLAAAMGGAFVYAAFGILRRWVWNSRQPVVTAEAWVADKNFDVGRGDDNDLYRVAFDVWGSGRRDFSVSEREYRRLSVGDAGTLTFQGTRLKEFKPSTV